jgi:uncharacterized protein
MMAINKTPKDLNDLGDQYFYGQGVEKNIEVAFTYYKQAGDLNNPVGLYNVGKYFLEKKDYKQAIDYFKKSSFLDYPLAFIKLSDIYLNGNGVRKNKKKAFKFLENAVNLNEVDAFHLLGKFYLLGIGTKKNENKAYEYFNLSAQNNNAEGMFLLGDLLLEGKKVKNDFESGFFYLDKAATNNNISAINRLKDLYLQPHSYLKKHSDLYRKEMCFYYDEILANLKNVEALKRTAFAYYEGNDFIKINFDKSSKYFKILYDLDNVDGYLGLGLSYMYGQGVQLDYERAKDYLEIASTRDSSKAKNSLGDLYRLGKGVEISYARARDYYLEAAKQEEVEALINLGLLHYRKQIKNATESLAFQFMSQASKKHNANAFYWLGIFYDKGVGCEKNLDEAKKMFEKAIELGNLGAKYKLATMLYDSLLLEKKKKKKQDQQFLYIKELLIDYINNPLHQEVNAMYSMYLLGDLYKQENFTESTPKVSRYWYELAASKNFTKAMVRVYEILKEKEPENALKWLNKACENPTDGEELFELGTLYEKGLLGIVKDEVRAKKLFNQSAKLNYHKAIEKVTMS